MGKLWKKASTAVHSYVQKSQKGIKSCRINVPMYWQPASVGNASTAVMTPWQCSALLFSWWGHWSACSNKGSGRPLSTDCHAISLGAATSMIVHVYTFPSSQSAVSKGRHDSVMVFLWRRRLCLWWILSLGVNKLLGTWQMNEYHCHGWQKLARNGIVWISRIKILEATDENELPLQWSPSWYNSTLKVYIYHGMVAMWLKWLKAKDLLGVKCRFVKQVEEWVWGVGIKALCGSISCSSTVGRRFSCRRKLTYIACHSFDKLEP